MRCERAMRARACVRAMRARACVRACDAMRARACVRAMRCERVRCERVRCERVRCERVRACVRCERVRCERVRCERVRCERVRCEPGAGRQESCGRRAAMRTRAMRARAMRARRGERSDFGGAAKALAGWRGRCGKAQEAQEEAFCDHITTCFFRGAGGAGKLAFTRPWCLGLGAPPAGRSSKYICPPLDADIPLAQNFILSGPPVTQGFLV